MSGSLTDRKKWKGQQLDYDNYIVDFSTHYCNYCLSDTQAQALNSLIEIYQYKTRWFSLEGTTIDQNLTTDWFEQLSGVLMSGCCCDDQIPVQIKYVGTVMYRSTDGGVTFAPAPEYDYRNTSIRYPKPSEVGLTNDQCQNADSIVVTFKDEINAQVTEDMGAAAILAVIAAVLLALLSEGTTLAISGQIVGVVSAILGAGVTAWQAAFTPTVWNTLRCLIFQNMTDGESIDQAGIDAVYAALDTELTGIVVPTLKGYIAAAGLVGLNNMIASNKGDPDADCSDCDEFWCFDGDFTTNSYDTIFSGLDITGGQNYNTVWTTGVGWQTTNGAPNYSVLVWKMDDIPGMRYLKFTMTDNGDVTVDGRGDTLHGTFTEQYQNPDVGLYWDGSPTNPYHMYGKRSVPIISGFHAEGVGSNPFGADNCTESHIP